MIDATAEPRFDASDHTSAAGLGLLLLLLVAVGGVLWRDHHDKLDAAQRQTRAYALGADRVVSFQLRNLARAMRGVAGDSENLHLRVPGQAAALLTTSVQDVASRHRELAMLGVMDAQGGALTGGPSDRQLPTWFRDPRNRAGNGELVMGKPFLSDGEWLLPLAVPAAVTPTGGEGWVVAQLRLASFDSAMKDMDLGKDGVATLVHRDGTVVARSRASAKIGRTLVGAEEMQLGASANGVSTGASRLDGVDRIRAYRHLQDYPLVVFVGVARDAVLAPWWQFAAVLLVASMAYALAWQWLVRRTRRLASERVRLKQQVDSSEQLLARAEDQYRFLFQKNPLPYFIYDAASLRFLEVNDIAQRTYGYSREEFLERGIEDIRPPEDVARLRGALAHSPSRGDGEVWRHVRKDGSVIKTLIESTAIDFNGVPARFVMAQDVTSRLNDEARLAYLASHDAATGLANREALVAGFNRAILAAEAAGRTVSIVYLQFNHLSLINDTLGHAVGDDVLSTLASRLRDQAPDPEMVARIGGVEFAFIVSCGQDAPLDPWLAAVAESLAQPLTALGTMHEVTASVGHASYPQHGEDAELLLKHAGLAAHEAKRQGSKEAIEFSPMFEQVLRERLDLVARLQEAIARGEFELFFQPQYRASDRRPISVEALIRWRHPERGLIPPAVFISICEDSGLIVPLGQWILREACLCHRRLVAAGWTGISVAVNVSSVQFQSGHLVDDIRALVAEFGIPRGGLELELTESIVMENSETAISTLRELRALGVLLAIDDFGTGYSSMAYLRHLPVDKLKIDREFVDHVEQDDKNAAICETIIAIGHRFGLEVVAEGVETLSQLEWLRTNGCDALQGYVLARPMPFDQMLAALGSETTRSTPGRKQATG